MFIIFLRFHNGLQSVTSHQLFSASKMIEPPYKHTANASTYSYAFNKKLTVDSHNMDTSLHF